MTDKTVQEESRDGVCSAMMAPTSNRSGAWLMRASTTLFLVALFAAARASQTFPPTIAPTAATFADRPPAPLGVELLPGAVSASPTATDSGASTILHGREYLSRTQFLQDRRLGLVTDIAIARGTEEGASGAQAIVVAGTKAVIRSSEQGKTQAITVLQRAATNLKIVDVQGDGLAEYLDRGGHGWRDAALYGSDGAVLWTYGDKSGLNSMAAGDVDGDGTLDFVAGFNGATGLHRVDSKGQAMWRMPGSNIWHVEVVSAHGTRAGRIVHTDTINHLVTRDATGQTVTEFAVPRGAESFVLCRWPSDSDPELALTWGAEVVRLIDWKGRQVLQLPAPGLDGDSFRVSAILARLRSEQSDSLVVVASNRRCRGSIVYVYDRSGKLSYHERLGDVCRSVVTIRRTGMGSDTILVGGLNQVWRYEARVQSK